MKRIVICCDGTWSRPGAKSPTNVAKLALAVADQADDGTEQRKLYQRGVGTGRFDRLPGGALGVGLSRHVIDCYRFLVQHYAPGDELFFFGFSRGAYTARSTVGLVRNAGILRREHANRVDEAYALYRGRGDDRHPNGLEARLFRSSFSHDPVPIRFVGVWDTVGALGVPGVPRRLAGRLWTFHDTSLSSWVHHAYQALAIDERRRPFAPSLWHRTPSDEDTPDPDIERTLEQVWFAGYHGDVGGGCAECGLADVTLQWMARRAADHGLALDAGRLVATTPPDPVLRREGRQICPEPDGKMNRSDTGAWKLLGCQARTLARPDASGVWLASCAETREAYRPQNVADYLDAGGPVRNVA